MATANRFELSEPCQRPHRIHEVVKYPDPVLAKPGEPVTVFDAELKQLVEEMFESMYAAQGIGLAAPQIGISQAPHGHRRQLQEERPKTSWRSSIPRSSTRRGKQVEEEGCLSLPEIREKVQRAAWVKVRAQNVKGEWFEVEGEELLARALQHEIDHLDGVLFIDRLSRLKRDLVSAASRSCKRTASGNEARSSVARRIRGARRCERCIGCAGTKSRWC